MRRCLKMLVRAYQCALAPFISTGCCRFAPSCSHYAEEALSIHPLPKAVRLTLRRVLRCHPWGGEGYDPVPPAKPSATQQLATPQ